MAVTVICEIHKPLYVTVWKSSREDNIHWSPLDPISDEQIEEINAWVTDLKLGIRTSYNGWRLKNSQCVTQFFLRWDNT